MQRSWIPVPEVAEEIRLDVSLGEELRQIGNGFCIGLG